MPALLMSPANASPPSDSMTLRAACPNFHLIADVQADRNQPLRSAAPQRLTVGGFANAGEDTISELIEVQRARFTDSR